MAIYRHLLHSLPNCGSKWLVSTRALLEDSRSLSGMGNPKSCLVSCVVLR